MASKLGERNSLGATAVGEGKIGSQITSFGSPAVEFNLDRHYPSAVLKDESGIIDEFTYN